MLNPKKVLDRVFSSYFLPHPWDEDESLMRLLESALEDFFLSFAVPATNVCFVPSPSSSDLDTATETRVFYSLYNPLDKTFTGYSAYFRELTVFADQPPLEVQVKLYKSLFGQRII